MENCWWCWDVREKPRWYFHHGFSLCLWLSSYPRCVICPFPFPPISTPPFRIPPPFIPPLIPSNLPKFYLLFEIHFPLRNSYFSRLTWRKPKRVAPGFPVCIRRLRLILFLLYLTSVKTWIWFYLVAYKRVFSL